jgi:hypothetical protein
MSDPRCRHSQLQELQTPLNGALVGRNPQCLNSSRNHNLHSNNFNRRHNNSPSENTVSSTAADYLDGTTVTTGGIIFGDGTKLTQDATNFFWDNSNDRLGIGDASPIAALVIGSDAGATSVAGAGDVYIQNDLEVDGVIYGAVSGTITPGFTEGSVVFANSSGNLAQDNPNFFWNDTTNRLGIGTTSPDAPLHIGTSTSAFWDQTVYVEQ